MRQKLLRNMLNICQFESSKHGKFTCTVHSPGAVNVTHVIELFDAMAELYVEKQFISMLVTNPHFGLVSLYKNNHREWSMDIQRLSTFLELNQFSPTIEVISFF